MTDGSGGVGASRRRRGLRAAGWFFTGVAALLIVVAALVLLSARQTRGGAYDLPWAIAVLLAMAAGGALLGRHLRRESSRPPSHYRMPRLVTACACLLISALAALGTVALVITWVTHRLSDPIGLVYPASTSLAFAQLGRMMLANSRRAGLPGEDKDEDEDVRLAGTVRYRQACSDVNPVLILAAVALLAFGVWLVAAFGGPGGRPGPQGFLVMVPVLPGLWLLFLVQYLPYGIVLTDGYLQLGVRGVPRTGRMWLGAQVPLDAIRHWDVASSREFRARKAVYRPVPGKPVGAMHSYLMGARHVLWIHADPQRIRGRFPEYIMAHQFEFSSAADAGYTQNGLLYIGTRRPKALESALTMALPGRRLGHGRPHARS